MSTRSIVKAALLVSEMSLSTVYANAATSMNGSVEENLSPKVVSNAPMYRVEWIFRSPDTKRNGTASVSAWDVENLFHTSNTHRYLSAIRDASAEDGLHVVEKHVSEVTTGDWLYLMVKPRDNGGLRVQAAFNRARLVEPIHDFDILDVTNQTVQTPLVDNKGGDELADARLGAWSTVSLGGGDTLRFRVNAIFSN